MRRSWRKLIWLLVVTAAGCAAQTPPPSTLETPPPTTPSNKSVASAVRDSKTEKTSHAKKVFTDEDMVPVVTGPFSRLKMDGLDNTDQILVEIANYKKTHAPAETEEAIHEWYDEYDAELFAAIQDNQNRSTLMQENQTNGYELCQASGDYQQCAARQRSEQLTARNDQQTMMRNNAVIHRLQNALMKVRNGLWMCGLHYTWFKVRTTNNIDSI